MGPVDKAVLFVVCAVIVLGLIRMWRNRKRRISNSNIGGSGRGGRK